MANFQYEALNNKSGKTEKGELPAASQAEALARLQEMGLAPTKVDQVKAAPKKGKQKIISTCQFSTKTIALLISDPIIYTNKGGCR